MFKHSQKTIVTTRTTKVLDGCMFRTASENATALAKHADIIVCGSKVWRVTDIPLTLENRWPLATTKVIDCLYSIQHGLVLDDLMTSEILL